MTEKITPGRLDYTRLCPKGHPTSTDMNGRVLCFDCGGFIDDVVPVEKIKQVRKPRNLKQQIFDGWGKKDYE